MSKETNCTGIYLSNYLPHGTDLFDEIIFDDNKHYLDFKVRMSEKYRNFTIYWFTPMKRRIRFEDKKCRQPWYGILVDVNGNLGLCCNYVPTEKRTYGNIFDIDYNCSINHPLRILLRRELLTNNDKIPRQCEGCNILCDKWLADM